MRFTEIVVSFGAAALLVVAMSGCRGGEGDGKLLTGRIWVDHLPKTETEHFEIFVAIADDPVGIFQRTSRYEGSFSMFDYELRGGDQIRLLFPQDKSSFDVRFRARACSVDGFDYCLDLDGAPRGAKAYRSRKEWELDAKDVASLEAKIEAWRSRLHLDPAD